jgi:hypothetical protein
MNGRRMECRVDVGGSGVGVACRRAQASDATVRQARLQAQVWGASVGMMNGMAAGAGVAPAPKRTGDELRDM